MIRRRRMQEAVENLSDLTYDYCLNFDDIVEDLCLNNEEQEALSEIAEDMLIDEIWVRAKGRRGRDGKRIQYSRPGGKVWMSLDDPKKKPVFLAGKKGGWKAYQEWKKSQPNKQSSSDLVSDEVSPSVTDTDQFDTEPFGLTPDDSIKKKPRSGSTTGGTKRAIKVDPRQMTLF